MFGSHLMSEGIFLGKVLAVRSEEFRDSPYFSRNENGQRACQSKDTSGFHGGDDCIDLMIRPRNQRGSNAKTSRTYRLAAEWFPNNRTVLDGILCMSAGWDHSPLANVYHVHHTDHKVITSTSAFFLLVESSDQIISHVRPKVGRMERNYLCLFFKKKHSGGLLGPRSI